MTHSSGGLLQAVMDEDQSRVRQLVAGGTNLEERDNKQQTPLLVATKTDQFEIAEILIDGGANVMVASRFGWTVGFAAETSKIVAGPDADARQRVLQKLKARGFPFPAPSTEQVKTLVVRGAWPPPK